MKIIGFDCSTRLIAGFVIDGDNYSTIELAGKAADEVTTRINTMFLLAVHYLKKSKPDFVYIENAAYLQNIKTSFLIRSVVDAVRFACVLNNIPCQTVEITSWKKDVIGNGRAEKSDIMQFAKTKYGEKLFTNQDLADAAGVATYGARRLNKGD
jgi:Holliday junction resolvasome RuvABC endonuclease subunit